MADEGTIFILDDDAAVRDSLMALFEAQGLAVETYGAADDFLAAFDPPRPGCLVLDVLMPDVTGVELLERMAAKGISVPTIIITGHGDVPLAVTAMKAGALDFIEKPFAEDTILESVRKALAHGVQAQKVSAVAAEAKDLIGRLTPREHDVLEQIVIGRANKVIAHELGISPRTVEIHRARVMEKTKARSLSALARLALAAGIEPPEPPRS
jgi:two-component system response regulator FixJ